MDMYAKLKELDAAIRRLEDEIHELRREVRGDREPEPEPTEDE